MVSRALRRAPVTTQVAIPYAILIIPQALLNSNEHLGFIIGVLALALAGSTLVESFVRVRDRDRLLADSRRTLESYGGTLRFTAFLACAVGQITGVVSAAFGVGTIAAQVGLIRPPAALAQTVSLFSTWTVSGAALLVGAYLAGQLSRRTLHLSFLAIILLEAVRTSFTALTAHFISVLVYLVVLAVFAGTLKVRHCVVAVVAVVLLWPSVYQLRNDIREQSGVRVVATIGAYDRLRYDEQISRAAQIPEVPIEIGQPDLLDILRYGLVPRLLDPDRPSLGTAKKINAFLGGGTTSAYTFLPVTTLYVLQGPVQTVLFYAALAVILAVALKCGTRLTPARLIVFGLVSSGPLGWFTSYPDETIVSMQGILAAIPLLVTLGLGRRSSVRRVALPSTPAQYDAARTAAGHRSVGDPVAPPDGGGGLPQDAQVESD